MHDVCGSIVEGGTYMSCFTHITIMELWAMLPWRDGGIGVWEDCHT